MHRASSRDMNQLSFRHSCHSLPLKDSTVALSVGVPGREKSILMPLSYTYLSSIFPANSEPLSVFSNCGNGRPSAMLFSISATSVERRFPGIRGCTDRYPSAGVAVVRQTKHQRQNPCSRRDSDADPEAAAGVAVRIYCGVAV